MRSDSTVFVAATDAAAGRLWPEESVGSRGCGQTQRRWLLRCGDWLGVSGSLACSERAAGTFGLPLRALLTAQGGWSRSVGRRARGGVLEALLQAKTWSEADLVPLLRVGAESGLIGRAWIVGEGGVVLPVFRVSGTGARASPSCDGRATHEFVA